MKILEEGPLLRNRFVTIKVVVVGFDDFDKKKVARYEVWLVRPVGANVCLHKGLNYSGENHVMLAKAAARVEIESHQRLGWVKL